MIWINFHDGNPVFFPLPITRAFIGRRYVHQPRCIEEEYSLRIYQAATYFSTKTVSHNNDSWIFSEASTLLWMVKTISFYDQLSSYLLCFMKQISSFIKCSWKGTRELHCQCQESLNIAGKLLATTIQLFNEEWVETFFAFLILNIKYLNERCWEREKF